MRRLTKQGYNHTDLMIIPHDYLTMGLSFNAESLLLRIYKLCQQKGYYEIKQAHLEVNLKISEATYKRALKELRDKNLLITKQQGNGKEPLYFPTHPYFEYKLNNYCSKNNEQHIVDIYLRAKFKVLLNDSSGSSPVSPLIKSGSSLVSLLIEQGAHHRAPYSLYIYLINIYTHKDNDLSTVGKIKIDRQALGCVIKNNTDQTDGQNDDSVIKSGEDLFSKTAKSPIIFITMDGDKTNSGDDISDRKNYRKLDQELNSKNIIKNLSAEQIQNYLNQLIAGYEKLGLAVGDENDARNELIKKLKGEDNPDELIKTILQCLPIHKQKAANRRQSGEFASNIGHLWKYLKNNSWVPHVPKKELIVVKNPVDDLIHELRDKQITIKSPVGEHMRDNNPQAYDKILNRIKELEQMLETKNVVNA